MVFLSADGKTIIEQRKGKGIWQNLYQFPLIETDKPIKESTVKKLITEHELLQGKDFELSLYNNQAIVHKLSHQHLHTKFWIINTTTLNRQGVSIKRIHDYAVPILIGNFIEAFNF